MTPQSKPFRVLIVDDDAMSRELLTVLIEGEGYTAENADSGEAALALIGQATSPPDLVLTDVQMPGTTGARLADELHRACGAATLLLAMSGSQPPQEAISQFDGFLLKPFAMEQVAAALLAHSQLTNGATAAREGRRVVVSAPARTALPKTKSIPIHAPSPEKASNKSMASQVQEEKAPETVPTDSTSDSLALNEKIYQQLAGSMPVKQLLEMYTMCLDDARERIAIMRTSVAIRDSAGFTREAHAIKGGCGMLGATELHRMAARLELSGLESAGTQSAQSVNSLDELTAACDRLERMLGSRV